MGCFKTLYLSTQYIQKDGTIFSMAFTLQTGPVTKQSFGKHISHAISRLGVTIVIEKLKRKTQKSAVIAKKRKVYTEDPKSKPWVN